MLPMRLVYDQDNVKVYHGDARNLHLIPDCSVHLVVTSPPYFNARTEYSEWATYPDYIGDMQHVWHECFRVLVNGGRIAINVPHVYGRENGKDQCLPIEANTIKGLEIAGFSLRGAIVWDKGVSVVSSSTAWGSWMSASNPSLRDQHEVIIVAHKGSPRRLEKGESTITAEDFTNWTRSIWTIPPVSNSWHPAPFPAEIPRRLIELYTFKGEIVLDPMAGSCTTGWAASKAGRKGVCVEASMDYITKACGPMFLISEESC